MTHDKTARVEQIKRAFDFWFFRDLTDEQRLSLIRLALGDQIAKECGPTHGYQRHALKQIMRGLAALTEASLPDASDQGAGVEDLVKIREHVVLALAFLGRDVGTDRAERTIPEVCGELAKADALLLAHLRSDQAEPQARGGEDLLRQWRPKEMTPETVPHWISELSTEEYAQRRNEEIRSSLMSLEIQKDWLQVAASMLHTAGCMSGSEYGSYGHSCLIVAEALIGTKELILAALRRSPAAAEVGERPKVWHLGVALQGIACKHADILTPRQIEALYQAANKLWDTSPDGARAREGE